MDRFNSLEIHGIFAQISNEPSKALCGSTSRPNNTHRLGKRLTAGLAVITMLMDLKPKTVLPKRFITNNARAASGFSPTLSCTFGTNLELLPDFFDFPKVS